MKFLLSTFYLPPVSPFYPNASHHKGIMGLEGEMRKSSEDRPQMMGEIPVSSLNTVQAPLYYVLAAQSRHNLRPQKQTQALLIKQIFHSSFNPRY
jgi:hypothetical protein